LVQSFLTVADARARQYVEWALVEEARLWPDFLLQVGSSHARRDLLARLLELNLRLAGR
jgi:hypothetical protein